MLKRTLDTELAIAFIDGNIDAFNALYYKYNNAVFANICKLIQQKEIAEDILQEVFLSLWENRSKLKEEQSIPGWLFVVSYNKSVNYLEKLLLEKRIAAGVVLNEELPVDGAGEDLFELKMDLVAEAIRRLPVRKKQAFTLCKLQGKSYAEAAQLMGVSAETVKEHLKISLKLIKEQVLNKYDSVPMTGLTLFFCFLQA
ncbi:MAG: sigma-70 family RNA polymerase sigma factor [Chitinophagaceae bacterium]|nr:sigma-70 family RNA polymerase sigma factor [Chitinophagaceae bacterium]